MNPGAVLGVDPGTHKAGYALVMDRAGPALALGVEPIGRLAARLDAVLKGRALRAIALGRGTNAAEIRALLAPLAAPIVEIDERDTTYRARALYFADYPPRGWRRLIPLGLQLPPRPIDDYAALLIARRYFDLVENEEGRV